MLKNNLAGASVTIEKVAQFSPYNSVKLYNMKKVKNLLKRLVKISRGHMTVYIESLKEGKKIFPKQKIRGARSSK